MRKTIPFLFLLFFCGSLPAFSQDHDGDIHININEAEIEEFFEELGRSIEQAFEGLSETDTHISITFDEEKFETSMEQFGEAMERLGESIEHAVKNMTIELRDLDADDIRRGDSRINGRSLDDVLDEIEEEYGQEVESVDRLLMKFHDDDLSIEMDVTLESGKEIRNIRKTFD